MTLAELQAQARAVRSALDIEAGEAAAVGRAGQAALAREAELKGLIELHEKVALALTRVGEERQEYLQSQVEGLVTRGLQVIFDESLSFHVVQAVKGAQATVDFVIRSQYESGVIDTPVMDARGGGMAAVVGFLLRLVILLLTPGARRILFLDETFAHVSAEYRVRLGQFLREVCDKAGVQIVMVSHDPEYAELADAHYGLSLGADGAAQVAVLAAPGADTVP